MKKYLYLGIGIVLFIGMLLVFYFINLPLSIKKIEQVNLSSGEEIILPNVTIDVELSKEIVGITHFIIRQDNSNQEIECEINKLYERNYQIMIEKNIFGDQTYYLIGYKINDQKIYFKKEKKFVVNFGELFKVSEFKVFDDENVSFQKVIVNIKIFNPFQVEIMQVLLNIGEQQVVFSKENIILEEYELYYQNVLIDISYSLDNLNIVKLASMVLKYQDNIIDYFPKENFFDYVNIYQEVVILDVIGPNFIYLESKEFYLKIILKEDTKQMINSFIISVGDKEIEGIIEDVVERDGDWEYSVCVLNPKIDNLLEINVNAIIINDKNYRITSPMITLEVKKALDNCVLKSKSATVMKGTRLAFYLECGEINEGVNLYKFSGKFNNEEFEGYNYINYPKEMQEQASFAFVDVKKNVIFLMTLPVSKLDGQEYCEFYIDKLYYFYDNQENVYELKQSLWVIPEEVILVIKDFYMTKKTYDLTKEIPEAKLELLISRSIQIEKIILDVNGALIENNFKNGGTLTSRNTYVFDLIAYRPTKEKTFSVKIYAIIYNGQGTIGTKNDFDNTIYYQTIP
ncbi:MAG: hypothetical protein GX203_01865 [Acholeplasmataceae bacterium]|nr:hypothetical protein [Acholeplasmataceae bacterium]